MGNKYVNHRQFKIAEALLALYVYKVPLGDKLEDLLDPRYWVHVLNKVNDYYINKIIAVAEDNSFYAELLVVGKDKHELNVELLFSKNIGESVDVEEDIKEKSSVIKNEEKGLEVRYVNNAKKWGVLDLATNEWLLTGIPTKKEAGVKMKEIVDGK